MLKQKFTVNDSRKQTEDTPSMATPTTNQTPSSNNNAPKAPANAAQDSMGVYLRNGESGMKGNPQKELDVLWSQDAPTSIVRNIKDENHPLLTFIAGLLAGVVLTTLFFWVFNSRPQTPVLDAVKDDSGVKVQQLQEPEANTTTTDVAKDEAGKATTERSTAETSNTTEAKEAKEGTAETNAKTGLKANVYQVKPGDTLGGIANKFYGSTSPEYIQRIVEANKLSSKHSLSLNQELVIPPKSY
jgi:nucleoid-associated protein YgaU